MSIRMCAIAAVILSFLSNSQAYGDEASPGELRMGMQKTSTTPVGDQERVELILPAFVVHGIQPGDQASAAMARKLDPNGDAVVTPGLGLEYVSPGGLTLLAAVLKDCYDDLAGTLQAGWSFRVGKYSSFALTLGLYMRETPLSCPADGTSSAETFGTTTRSTGAGNCTPLDDYPWKLMTSVNGDSVDIIPMPFALFSTPIYRDHDFQVDLKVMSNLVLNEFGISIPFR